jgi:hypothetical protein
MSIKSVMAVAFGALLSASAMSVLAQDTGTKDEKTCCTAACHRHESGKMRCSLTGKTVETCCCVKKEGRLHCTLADKDVDTCCCRPADEAGGHDHQSEGTEPQE